MYKCLQRQSTQQLGLKIVTRTPADSNKEDRAQQLEPLKETRRLTRANVYRFCSDSQLHHTRQSVLVALPFPPCFVIFFDPQNYSAQRVTGSFNVRQLNPNKQLKQATRTKRLEQRKKLHGRRGSLARAEKNLGRGRFSKFSHSTKYAQVYAQTCVYLVK